MNFQQLEYIVAVDAFRHFVRAAEKTFVTQATLSMMIKKLEEELDVIIFDRSKQPIVPTEVGAKLIAQAKIILQEAGRMKELVNEAKGEISGELNIGIIPTLSPYLLPLFVQSFLQKYPKVKLKVNEFTTEHILEDLQSGKLDAGILATPLGNASLVEQPLFYEDFVVYASRDEKILKKKYALADDIDVNHLWLLAEGHCLRSQVINLCELKKLEKEQHQLDFEAGSLETLVRMVDADGGITILPELALNGLSIKQQNNIRYFKSPAPAREISLVTYRHFIKQNLLKALQDEILKAVPKELLTNKKKTIVEIS